MLIHTIQGKLDKSEGQSLRNDAVTLRRTLWYLGKKSIELAQGVYMFDMRQKVQVEIAELVSEMKRLAMITAVPTRGTVVEHDPLFFFDIPAAEEQMVRFENREAADVSASQIDMALCAVNIGEELMPKAISA